MRRRDATKNVAACWAIGLCWLAAAVRADDDAWAELEAAREGLAMESPLAANFVQSYVPAGFSSGDEETGRLFLSLPACLRWDYEEPYPRRYLLCGQSVWVWSPDEPVGDRFLQVSREEAGLDFLLLSVERLRERYEAALATTEDGAARIELAPTSEEAPFARAAITLGGESRRPVRLEYADREGNETRFDLSLYRGIEPRGPGEAGLFTPPDIEWIDAD